MEFPEIGSLSYNELSKKTGFNLYQSRHCAYITFSVKTRFLKILSVPGYSGVVR